MDMNEFNKTVARTEDDATVTFDVRPFGDRQGEALDSYLSNWSMALQANAAPPHSKLLVVLCDSSTAITKNANRLLGLLNAKGVAIEIRHS